MARYPNQRLHRTVPLTSLMLGNSYSAGGLFSAVADTNAKEIVVENTTEDTALLVLEPVANASAQYYSQKLNNVTVDTAGDAATVTNKHTGESDSSAATVTTAGANETGAISGGTAFPQITAGGGNNPSNSTPGASGSTNITNVVAPGDNMAVRVTNQSGSAQDVSITVDFIEFSDESL